MRRGGEQRGSTLVELLVCLVLLTTVLLIAVAVESAVLRRLRAEEAHLPRGDLELALARLQRDIREASAARIVDPKDGVTGPVLFLREAVQGVDAAYAVDEDGKLLRAVENAPGGQGNSRVLLDGVVWHEFQTFTTMPLVVVSLRLSDGTSREVTYGMRARPGSGWGGAGWDRGGPP